MADAGTLISNRGDSGLGLGSNASIPVSGGKELTAIEQAGRDATLLGIEQQRQIFNRKVAEHDRLLSLLNEDKIKVGDMIDRDRPIVKQAFESLDAAFAERAKKGFNNIDATVAYNKALRKAQDTVTQAQARYVVDKQVKADAASELPSEREVLLKEHGNYLSGFWNDYTPHVKAITIDHPGMTTSILRESLVPNSGVPSQAQTVRKTITKNVNGKLTTIDVETNQPVKAGTTKVGASQGGGRLSMFTTTPGKFYDYQKMVSNASDDFHDEKQRLNQTKYMDFVLNQTDPSQLKAIVDHANDRIEDYNKQRGFDELDEGYVSPVEIIVAPDGTRHTNLSVPEFNAKMALASINGDYFEKDKVALDKEAANIIQQQKELQERIRHDKATEGVDWAKYNLEKEKFIETAKGSEESKNAALVFANGLFADLADKGSKTADGGFILTPDQIRTLTADQLKFLGKETPPERDALGNLQPAGLQPLELGDNEIMKVNSDGTVLIMKNATYNPNTNKWGGTWDNTRSTSVFNAARNVVNEENVKSGTKERNAYLPIDLRDKKGVIQVDVSGGGTTKTTVKTAGDGLKNVNGKYPLPKGQPRIVEQGGNTYTWDEKTGNYQ